MNHVVDCRSRRRELVRVPHLLCERAGKSGKQGDSFRTHHMRRRWATSDGDGLRWTAKATAMERRIASVGPARPT